MNGEVVSDWVGGDAAISYQCCRTCGHLWYFRRHFCPHCGCAKPAQHRASGRGTVEAVTVVTRAPSAQLQSYAPYGIVIVAVDEGFSMMGQGERWLAIGDRVAAQFLSFGGRVIPFFKRMK